jgi:hypothetical protein
VHDEPAGFDIENPTFDKAGPDVQSGFLGEIESERGVGYFDDQAKVARPGIAL